MSQFHNLLSVFYGFNSKLYTNHYYSVTQILINNLFCINISEGLRYIVQANFRQLKKCP